MQGRLLRALLEDDEALRQFIACAVIEEVAEGGGELLREGLKVKSEEEALRPVIDALGGEVVEYYAGVEEGVMFAENIELLMFSTPMRCLGVRGRVVEMSEGAASPIITAIQTLEGFFCLSGPRACCLSYRT